MTAADIIAALGGRMRGKSAGTACCPAHNDRSPSLSIADGGDGKLLVHCHAGCEQVEVIDALRRLGLWPGQIEEPCLRIDGEREHRQQRDAARERDRARRDAFVAGIWQRVWADAQPARGSPIDQWLLHRAIDRAKLDLDRLPLRWAPRCPMGRALVPAMVALMTDQVTCRPTGLHRTFLLPDGSGKAPVDPVRMMLGNAGLIRLSPDDDVELGLGICEGIETGLSVMSIGWRPIWACGSLNALRHFAVVDGVECLTIFADPKPNELAGARACAARWAAAGRDAFVRLPPLSGDFNYLLRVAG
jgi:hypothetical protein